MTVAANVKYYSMYPLMWVMLLWALTLPGHELAVYSFLVKGTASEVASSLRTPTGSQEGEAVKQQTVQAFLDAKVRHANKLVPQQAIRSALQLLGLSAPTAGIASHVLPTGEVAAIAQLLSGSILPNAP
ncbi:hypothetical protein [Pontibacter roseus]|uniref:hypothetical protein n=1 Tax=Pontibacter roseus TaxID=336989 RepID=UPI00037DCAA0|nr:hypothetical protein [Pontibacter roseus]